VSMILLGRVETSDFVSERTATVIIDEFKRSCGFPRWMIDPLLEMNYLYIYFLREFLKRYFSGVRFLMMRSNQALSVQMWVI